MHKRRTFSSNVGHRFAEQALSRLRHQPGIIGCWYTSGTLSIEYDRHTCHYQQLCHTLQDEGLIPPANRYQKTKQQCIDFMEHNTYRYQYTPNGWDFYLQTLHLILDRDY